MRACVGENSVTVIIDLGTGLAIVPRVANLSARQFELSRHALRFEVASLQANVDQVGGVILRACTPTETRR